jgi:hypothetical protein
MKSMVKVLLGVVAGTLVLAVAAPPAEAQCGTGAREFGSHLGGAADNDFRFDPAGTHGVLGTEFGRFWSCVNSNDGNNFGPGAHRPMGTGCPSRGVTQANGGWWQVSQTTLRGISGLISGTGCVASTCPTDDLCVVVEDWEGGTGGGPPGVGKGAYFIGFRSNITTAAQRYWDLSRQCGPSGGNVNCQAPLQKFPVPKITSATTVGADRSVTAGSDIDPAVNVYVYTPDLAAASLLIDSYDLMMHTGTSDPGRDRNALCGLDPCWTPLATIPYNNAAAAPQQVTVPCNSVPEDAFLALGLSFEGGSPGGPVPSLMVGAAIQVECGGDIADPDPRPKKGARVDERPGRPTERPRGVR